MWRDRGGGWWLGGCGRVRVRALGVQEQTPILCFHSCGQHLCKFIGTKESVCIRKEFNSQRIGLGHQHGRRFIVLGHQYGRHDVMWKHTIVFLSSHAFLPYTVNLWLIHTLAVTDLATLYYCQTQKTMITWEISGMLIVYWPITIKFRIRKQTSKPHINYCYYLQFSYLARYWLFTRNTVTFHKHFWCSCCVTFTVSEPKKYIVMPRTRKQTMALERGNSSCQSVSELESFY